MPDCTCGTLRANAVQKYDPTRTTALRQRFEGEAARRFRRLKGRINQAIIEQDGFGIKTNRGEFDFPRAQDKVASFMEWLQEQQRAGILEIRQGEGLARAADRAWSTTYVRSAYQRGMAQSAAKLRQEGVDVAPEWVTEAFSRPFHVDRVGLAYTRTFSDLVGITGEMDKQISRALADAISQGKGARETARSINDRVDKIGITRARMLARTECLTGDMLVDGAEVQSAHKRWYEGEVIEIVTADGRNITATPNHPMLTQRGWVFAGQITNADDLICNSTADAASSTGDQNVDHAPTAIAQVFDATATVGVIEREATGKPDFHGDGMEGYVDVASAARHLRVGSFSPVFQHTYDFNLPKANEPGTRFCPLSGRLLPVDEAVDFVAASLLNAALLQPVANCLPANVEPFGKASQGFARGIQFTNGINRQSINECGGDPSCVVLGFDCVGSLSQYALSANLLLNPAERVSRKLGDLIARGAIYIHPDDCIAVPSGAGFAVIGNTDAFLSVSDFASFPQSFSHRGGGKPHASANLSSGKPATVKADRVVHINKRRFSGHVYNLSTPDGYFTIQGGAYTGNTIRAHAEASLNTYEEAGILGVGVEAEFRTAQDDRVCPECQALEGQTFTIEEARGVIPVHPRCRCAWLPMVDDPKAVALR